MIGARDLHNSLKTEVIAKANAGGAEMALTKLAWGKNDTAFSLHVAPHTHSMSGLQITDFLSYLGFARQACAILRSECYVRQVPESFDLDAFGAALDAGYKEISQAEGHLQSCGFPLDQPEGWGYFYGKHSGGRSRESHYSGDGHTSAVTPEQMNITEDDVFQFVFTWIQSSERERGWTIHYHPKHPPLSVELQGVFQFLGIKEFKECPQFEFESCGWRHIEFEDRGNRGFDSNATAANRCFEAQAAHFSLGIKALLAAQATMEKVGMGFLPSFARPETRRAQEIDRHVVKNKPTAGAAPKANGSFDVAVSFAGSERKYAEELAIKIRAAGFEVFYDEFYPETLWGKDLAEFFHEIYSTRSRYCVVFVSKEYLNREWTIHERRSAQERMIKEKGGEYILPIKVDEVDLPGVPATIGYLSIATGIDKIAGVLLKKLKKK